MNQNALPDKLKETKKQMFKVYSIIEKPGEQKNVWLDIGIASMNRDESISCKLDCLPINGKLQLRRYDPLERTQNWKSNNILKNENNFNERQGKSWQREEF
ncbi:MAG: hypothetical protein JXR91_17025 [Deltaproteobacteria bacterium]|nr:hypothetical protein [Deltaproteobacteria bacterium]